jgi:flagellin-like protein
MIHKKGVSPVISTVLLVMIVIVIALIIIIWARGFIKEAITKEISGNKKTVEQFCKEAALVPIINDDGSFGLKNSGNIPIYAINLKLISGGNSIIERLVYDNSTLNPGYSLTIPNYNYNNFDHIIIIPILIGKSKSGIVNEYTCPENDGIEIK